MSKVYTQVACDAFAKVAASMLGVSSIVKFAHGSPRTDGHTVWLPEVVKALDEDGFRCWCALAWHELTHVVLDTAQEMDNFVNGRTNQIKGPPELLAFAFNVVADIADEIRLPWIIEHCLGYSDVQAKAAENLLRHNNATSWEKLHKGILELFSLGAADKVAHQLGLLPLCSYAPSEWNKATIKQAREKIKQLRALRFPINEAFAAAKPSASRPRKPSSRARRSPRASRNWKENAALVNAAAALAEVLRPYWPNDPAKQPKIVRLEPAQIDPLPGDTVATEAEGKGFALCANVPGSGASSGGPPQAGSKLGEDPEFKAKVDRYVRVLVERMIVSEDGGRDDGQRSGPRIGEAHRAIVDRKPFLSSSIEHERERATVAVLLDCSSSMDCRIVPASIIAEAFASNLERVAKVHRILFSSDHAAVKSFEDPLAVDMRGTNTTDALVAAMDAIGRSPGKRSIVIVTDGCPSNGHTCRDAAKKIAGRGIRAIAVGYQCDSAMVGAYLPGALTVSAQTPAELGAALSMAAQRIV